MTIFGWDMSHYDAIPAGGGARVASEGFSFVTHKAGGDSNDAEIGAWWSAFRSFRDRLLLGAYWVLYPGNPAGRADAFLARLDATCPGWRDGPFILQLDCEKWAGKASTVPGKADIKAACDRLVAKMPKLRPIVYAPKWVYGDSLAGLGYPLWASSYVTGTGTASKLYPGDSSSRWSAYGQAPEVLQFTSSATIAGQTTCDANAYRGTLAQLTALVAPGWTKEDDMPTADEIAAAVWGYKFTRPDGPDARGNTQTSAGAYQAYSDIQPRAAADAAAGRVITALTPVIAAGKVDVGQLVAQLVSPLTAAVLAALPQVDVTPDELQAAIVGALKQLATS